MNNSILFIGAGNMGFAIMSAWENSGGSGAYVEKDTVRVEWLAKNSDFLLEKLENISNYSTIVLSIKPQQVEAFFKENSKFFNKEQTLISVVAGLTISKLESLMMDTPTIVRTMPNTPALVGEGLIAVSSASHCAINIATNLFSKSGKVIALEESLMDSVTGVSGSGPAYVFSFIENYIIAAEKNGILPELAKDMVMQTLFGSLKLLETSTENASELRKKVTSPNGTTFAGLQKMEELGFGNALISGIDAAVERSKELGK